MRGRQALMPRIGKAFVRLAAREGGKNDLTLSIAHEKDERKAMREAKEMLAQTDPSKKDITVKLDETLIGGWRLEGSEQLIDASWKKHLLSIYNRATQ